MQRDFTARPVQEQQWLIRDTWCNNCQQPDLGMVEPVEYEDGGQVYVAGRCAKCGLEVISEIIER